MLVQCSESVLSLIEMSLKRLMSVSNKIYLIKIIKSLFTEKSLNGSELRYSEVKIDICKYFATFYCFIFIKY